MQRQAALAVSALLLAGGCAASQPAHRDERFAIYNYGDFTAQEVERVRAQLDAGQRALQKYLGPAPAGKFPVVVNLRPGRGVSHSYHGQLIELFWVREMRAPIIHELTHVLAGYTPSRGHWTQEGFASYMQDRYGEDAAFPTYRAAHALVKVLHEEGSLLPMLEVMGDRNRAQYFGMHTLWQRWLAYTQSTSFCGYLIEQYGHEKFVKVYDVAVEAADFKGLYGKNAEALAEEWLRYVAGLPDDDAAKARVILRNMKTSFGRQ